MTAKAKVTSFDVARKAGVSRATVSLVLNRSDKASISEGTREKVFRAARELGYSPNSAGRMLVSGHSETMALVLSDADILLSDGFVPHLLHGIGLVNREFGYHVLVDSIGLNAGHSSYRRLAQTRRIDGMIVLNPKSDDVELTQLIDEGFPIILIGSIRHSNEYSVNFSTRQGISAAVEHLVGLGHRVFGMVPFSQQGLVATDVRIATLRRSLKERDLELDADAVEYAGFSAESGFSATRTLLTRRPDITALFAGNDTIGIGVLSAINELGKQVPEDYSVVGFDDLPFARFLKPALTTIQTDGVDVGRKAAELLIKRLQGKEIEETRVSFSTKFVVRASTGQRRSS